MTKRYEKYYINVFFLITPRFVEKNRKERKKG